MANNGIPNEIICLVCYSNLGNSSCINIFCTSLSHNDELLASFVLGVIHPSALELNSNYICTQCYNLFQMLEQARWTATNIENEIFKIYQSSRNKKRLMIDKIVDATPSSNENDLIFENLQLQDKLDISNNLNQYVNIESQNDECGAPRKNLPTIIEDIHINNFQIIKSSKNLSSNNSNSIINEENEKTSSLLTTSLLNEIANYNQENAKIIPNHIYRCKVCSKLYESVHQLNEHLPKHEILHLNNCEEYRKEGDKLTNLNSHSSTFRSEKKKIVINANRPLNAQPIESSNQNCIELKTNLKVFNDITIDNNNYKTIFNGTDCENQNVADNIANSKSTVVSKSHQKNNIQIIKTAKKSKCNSKQLSYSCTTCGKMWKTSSELKSHMKTHSSVRPFMCEKCGRTYKHKHALAIHIGMHNGVNPFQCDFCNKCFTQKGALMRHLPIHTGEMPHQCEICGKRFVHHTSYNMHTLSHTRKKTHQCPNCNLLLLSTSHLKRHMRVHTGEKPYSCPSCGKRFAERYNLYTHQKIHGPIPLNTKSIAKSQYVCDLCHIFFDVEENLQNHLEKQHSEIQLKNVTKWITQRDKLMSVNETIDDN